MRSNLKRNEAAFSEVEKILKNADAGEKEHKARMRNRLMFKITSGQLEREAVNIKPVKRHIRKPVAILCSLVVVVLLGAFSTTSIAKEMINKVLAYLKIGNFEIVQYDHIPEFSAAPSDNTDQPVSHDETVKEISLKEAYSKMGTSFMLPTRLPKGYRFDRCVGYDSAMVSVQYRSDAGGPGFNQLSILITDYSKSSPNGIETEDVIETKEIDGKTVYFVNGIIIWAMGDLRYELYWPDYDPAKDMNAVKEIIGSLAAVK